MGWQSVRSWGAIWRLGVFGWRARLVDAIGLVEGALELRLSVIDPRLVCVGVGFVFGGGVGSAGHCGEQADRAQGQERDYDDDQHDDAGGMGPQHEDQRA